VRGTPYAELYGEIAADALGAPVEYDEARADLAGVLSKLELGVVETQYRELCAKTGMTDGDRTQLHALSRRLAELKGGASVGVVPST